MSQEEHIVIIGNGIAGVSAARWIRKGSQKRITIISGESEHFYSRTALMYIYMGHMRFQDTKPYEDWFWAKNRIELKKAWVNKINFETKSLDLENESHPFTYDKLILALGSQSNKFGWPGQDLPRVQGLYSLQDLESLEALSDEIQHGVIVGGGLIGIELAEMLVSRGKSVTMLVRETDYWDNVLPTPEAQMINAHIRNHHVDLRLSSNLKSIGGDGKAEFVELENGEKIDCQFVGLTAGVHPNIALVKDSALKVNRGILVNRRLKTNIEDVYAIGDCAEMENPPEGRRSIEAVWYVGKMQGKQLGKNICGEARDYDPGPWYNSAKFFDIEYQTYGIVMPKPQEGEGDFWWQDEKENLGLHLRWNQKDGRFVGVNAFGLRLRHDLFDQWLREGASVEKVLSNLKAANFDPELYRKKEGLIIDHWNRANPKRPVELKRRGLQSLIFSRK